jgi:hypothetical protein
MPFYAVISLEKANYLDLLQSVMGMELVTWIVAVVHDRPSCLVHPWWTVAGGARPSCSISRL